MGYIDKEKKQEYARQWIANRRATFFANKTCVRCGSTENLELDHIDPKQKISHNIWSWSESRRLAEIAKCQVLCRTCHQDKTIEERGQTRFPHDQKRYMLGCRCVECKAAHAKNNREWRWRTGRRNPRGPVVITDSI